MNILEDESIKLMQLNKMYLDIFNSEEYNLGKDCYAHSFRGRLNTVNNLRKFGILRIIKKAVLSFVYRIRPELIYDRKLDYKTQENYIDNNGSWNGRCAVYTAVYGGYDKVHDPLVVNPALDYYIFTDLDIPESSVWKKVKLPSEVEDMKLDAYHLSKFCKMFPHILLPDYDKTIWIDGNIRIIGDIAALLAQAENTTIAMYENPIHTCIYTEARYMKYYNRVDARTVNNQIRDYHQAGFPKQYGMKECSIIVRDNSSSEVQRIMHDWWDNVNKYTMRDQLSLPYVLWRNGKTIEYIKSLGGTWRYNPRYQYVPHLSEYTV